MDGFDSPSPCNQMAMVMIRDFLNAGNEVHLIQSRRKRLFDEIPDMIKGKRGLVVESVDRKVIDKTNFIVRFLDEIKWAFQSMKHWIKVKDADVVFLQSCPTAVCQLVLLKIFCRKPVLFNIYDVWPGHAMSLGVIKSKFLYNVFRWIQKIAYACCTKIAVMSEDMEEKLINEGVSPKKLCIVPAWFDENSAMEIPKEENRFLKKYPIQQDKFIVQFAGTIGYVFDYKTVLATAEELKDDENICFQMIGEGAFKEDFIRQAQEKGLTNIDFYPLQPIEIVPDVYSACSLEIIPLRAGVIGNGVPSKAPILMACHKVILNSVEENSHYYQLFNNESIGVSVPRGDAKKLADKIRYLAANPDVCKYMADNAKAYSYKYYSSTVCTAKFMNAFDEMVKA